MDRETFDLVQEMKKSSTNLELDEYGNKVHKRTHYSMKHRPLAAVKNRPVVCVN